jgi:hypothetical protein
MDISVYQMNVTVNRKTTEWKDMEWVHWTENKAVEKGQLTRILTKLVNFLTTFVTYLLRENCTSPWNCMFL